MVRTQLLVAFEGLIDVLVEGVEFLDFRVLQSDLSDDALEVLGEVSLLGGVFGDFLP